MDEPEKSPNRTGPEDACKRVLLEAIPVLREQAKRLEGEAGRQRDARELARCLDKTREAVDRLYRSSRWRATHLWGLLGLLRGREKTERYPPLDKELGRLGNRVARVQPPDDGETRPSLETVALIEKHAPHSDGPLVSVVTTTYQRAGLVGRAIRSVIAQRYGNWELVVVDDGSTDGTADAVAAFDDPRVRYVKRQHEGRSASLNAGLADARGELVAYLDSDNTWHPGFLQVMVGELRAHPGFDAAYCAQEMVVECAGEEAPLGERFLPFSRSLLENRNFMDLNGTVHTREAAGKAGGFNRELTRFVDWEFALRLTDEKAALAVPAALFTYRLSPENAQISFGEDRSDNEAVVQSVLARNRVELSERSRRVVGGYPMFSNRTVTGSRPGHRRPVSIVIPNWEVPECLRLCLESVAKYSGDHDCEVIVVDNASSSPGSKQLLDELDASGEVQLVRNTSNLGFTYAVNQGIKRAGDGRDIILLNNDAVATAGWLDGFMESRAAYPKAALIAPRQVLLPRQETNKTHVPACNPDREIDVTLSKHHDNVIPGPQNPTGHVQLRFAPFFCVYLCDWALREIGFLDHEWGRHYKSDRLYCQEILNRGHEIVYSPWSKLYHLVQQATGALKGDGSGFEKMFVENTWRDGEMPGEIE